ncbi:MAG: MarR family transcriptional regulator [Caenispirillum sp.]|nr:MarR family transcriptional regulator [Caenispirillum sp.]
MTRKVQLHIESLEEAGARFVDAWHRLERGEDGGGKHVSFVSLEVLMAALTPRRLDLLRSLHDAPAASVAELARRTGRDYKRVHEDVGALETAGLIAREADRLFVPFDEIEASLRL